MNSFAGSQPMGLVVAVVALILILLPIVRAIKAGYGAVALFIIVEMGLAGIAVGVGKDFWIFPIAWGFASLMGTLAIIGDDLRRALKVKAPAAGSAISAASADSVNGQT